MPLTHSEWNQETGGLEVAQAFAARIRGRNILITGVSPESIGSSTALAIASQAPNLLILASRTPSKLAQVTKTISSAYPDVNVKTVHLDLSSQEAVRQAASAVTQLTNRLDILVNNAAVMTPTLHHTPEGIESQFGSNHVGPFLFTNLLTPLLLAASSSSSFPGSTRVINLTSLGHRMSPVRFHDYNFEGKLIPEEERTPVKLPEAFVAKDGGTYNGYVAYAQAKTANILFSMQVTARLCGRGVVSYAVHPGSIWTGLSRNLDAEGEAAIRKTAAFWKNHDQGAATTLVAAFDPGLDVPEGVLLSDCRYWEAAPHARDPGLAERLWELSEKLVEREFKL